MRLLPSSIFGFCCGGCTIWLCTRNTFPLLHLGAALELCSIASFVALPLWCAVVDSSLRGFVTQAKSLLIVAAFKCALLARCVLWGAPLIYGSVVTVHFSDSLSLTCHSVQILAVSCPMESADAGGILLDCM